jgi:hypothetical protein
MNFHSSKIRECFSHSLRRWRVLKTDPRLNARIRAPPRRSSIFNRKLSQLPKDIFIIVQLLHLTHWNDFPEFLGIVDFSSRPWNVFLRKWTYTRTYTRGRNLKKGLAPYKRQSGSIESIVSWLDSLPRNDIVHIWPSTRSVYFHWSLQFYFFFQRCIILIMLYIRSFRISPCFIYYL